PRLNSSLAAEPRLTTLSSGGSAIPPTQPSRQSGWVSKASVLSSRLALQPSSAVNPRPRRAELAPIVPVSSPPESRSAAAMIASRASSSPGAHPWNFSPSMTYWMARLLPPVYHGAYTSGLKPCLSIRSQVMSHSTAAQPWPSPCGSDSVEPSNQPPDLIES